MLLVADFMTYSWATDTTKATSALNKAEGFVATVLGDISLKTYTDEVYDGNGEMVLILKNPNVVSVSSLKFSDDTVDPTTYFANSYGIRMYYAFPRGFWVIKVTYTAWWTKDTIPLDLKNAIYDLAYIYYQSWDSIGSNIKRESIDWASVEWGDLPNTDAPIEIINSYKTINV